MPYLFQVSLGPVQSFIVAARRTRDLKFSSSFLSELARQVAETITNQGDKGSLIFPAPETLSVEDGMPNKILAYLDLSAVEVQRLADDIARAISKHVEKMTRGILGHIEKRLENREDASDLLEEIRSRFAPGDNGQAGRAAQQIHDLVEYIWVAVPYDAQQPAKYAERRQELDALLTIRKNTRDFAPAPLISSEQISPLEARRGMPKSSIDGLLESVIPEEAYPPYLKNSRVTDDMSRREKEDYERKATLLREVFDAGPHEKLSGVDLLKRLGTIQGIATDQQSRDKRTAFPSTSHIAALPFLAGLQRLPSGESESAQEQLNAYITQLEQVKTVIPSFELDILPKAYQAETWEGKTVSLGAYDGALLYPERFPDVVGDAQEFQQAHDSFQQATNLLDALLRDIGFQPTPYYALFQADGDSMGKLIDAQARRENGMQQHRKLSENLATLSTKIKDIVKHYQGVLVYTGGDDVLALLPLHTALECAVKLASAFKEALKEFTDKQNRPPTLSAGLAILHHLHPLSDALRIAHAAEIRAKGGTKNALAITLQKRGGPPCEVGGEWEPFYERLTRLIAFCREDTIPSGMAYELRELALRLALEQEKAEPEQEGQKERAALSPAYLRYAALRVFQRKLGEAGEQRADKRKAALALYALKRMVGLIDTDDESETPEQAFKAVKKMLKLKEEESAALREQIEPFKRLQPVRVEVLANESIVARFFADAQRLAHSEQGAGGKQE